MDVIINTFRTVQLHAVDVSGNELLLRSRIWNNSNTIFTTFSFGAILVEI